MKETTAALSKDVTVLDGAVVANYHVVDLLSWDRRGKVVTVVVSSYWNEAAASSGPPLDQHVYSWILGVDIDIDWATNVQDQIAAKLKSLEKWEDAQDAAASPMKESP